MDARPTPAVARAAAELSTTWMRADVDQGEPIRGKSREEITGDEGRGGDDDLLAESPLEVGHVEGHLGQLPPHLPRDGGGHASVAEYSR